MGTGCESNQHSSRSSARTGSVEVDLDPPLKTWCLNSEMLLPGSDSRIEMLINLVFRNQSAGEMKIMQIDLQQLHSDFLVEGLVCEVSHFHIDAQLWNHHASSIVAFIDHDPAVDFVGMLFHVQQRPMSIAVPLGLRGLAACDVCFGYAR
jgi:hypothetical protein